MACWTTPLSSSALATSSPLMVVEHSVCSLRRDAAPIAATPASTFCVDYHIVCTCALSLFSLRFPRVFLSTLNQTDSPFTLCSLVYCACVPLASVWFLEAIALFAFVAYRVVAFMCTTTSPIVRFRSLATTTSSRLTSRQCIRSLFEHSPDGGSDVSMRSRQPLYVEAVSRTTPSVTAVHVLERLHAQG